jgi:4-diphosphocytidyl-2-C-methyl-D-erythritol kinase
LTERHGGAVAMAAPAKLNLYLHVTGRRPDGFHELDSLIAFAAVHDTVIARPAGELTLTVTGPFADALADEPDNLVLRAARALAGEADVEQGAALTLIKRLPVASGIGGGSSDAAAAIQALEELWELDLADETLDELALALGADVPVCLSGVAAQVGGIGERIEPVPPLPEAPLVLVNPLHALATPAVFRARGGGFSRRATLSGPYGDAEALAAALAATANDLTAAARGILPELGAVIDALETAPGVLLARMSGSGATCFALFAEDAAAEAAATMIAEAHPGWWVAASHLVSDVGDVTPDESETA